MKKILGLLILFYSNILLGQGIVRPITITPLSLSSNDVYNIVITVASNNPVSVVTQFVNNVTFETNVTFNQQTTFNSIAQFLSNITVSGKATFTNNLFISQLSFATNSGSTNVLVLNCTEQYIRASHDFSYSGFSIPAEYGNTNVAWASVLVTNDSANAFIKAYFPSCIGDTNNFITNQAAFTVKKYPLAGTNVAFNSLK